MALKIKKNELKNLSQSAGFYGNPDGGGSAQCSIGGTGASYGCGNNGTATGTNSVGGGAHNTDGNLSTLFSNRNADWGYTRDATRHNLSGQCGANGA